MEPRMVFEELEDALRCGAGSSPALQALARELTHIGAADLAALSNGLRGWRFAAGTRWSELTPADCRAFAREAAGWPLLALATLHRSGWVRQAALRMIAMRPRAEQLPFVLARVNDWVPEVRALAGDIVRVYLTPEHADGWLEALGALEALGRARRSDHGPLLRAVHELLGSTGVRPKLLAGLGAADATVRRRCARLVAALPSADTIRALYDSADPLLRLTAVRTMIARDRIDPELLERALGDPSLPVRRTAFVAALRRGLVDAPQIVRQFLLDPSLSVRDPAREWLLEQHPQIDLVAAYLHAVEIESGRRLGYALLGLGETGSAAQVPLLAAHFDHPHAAVRRLAVLGLDALGTRAPAALFLAPLADPAAPVVRAAADALAERMQPALVPTIWRIIDAGRSAAADYVARCFLQLDTWTAFSQLCRLIPRAPDACATQLDSWLRRHVNGIRDRPSDDTVARGQASLRAARATLPPRLHAELEFVLRTTR